MPVEVTNQGKLWCVKVTETFEGLPWVFQETSEDLRTALRVGHGAVRAVITVMAILDHPEYEKFKALEREILDNLHGLSTNPEIRITLDSALLR